MVVFLLVVFISIPHNIHIINHSLIYPGNKCLDHTYAICQKKKIFSTEKTNNGYLNNNNPRKWSEPNQLNYILLLYFPCPCLHYYLPPSQKSCTALRRLVCPVLPVIWWTYPEYQLDLLETWVPVAWSVTLSSICTKSMNFPLVHLVRFRIPWFTFGRWWNRQFQIS